MLKELIKLNSVVAEGPLWSTKSKSLFWIDIGKKQLHHFNFSTNNTVENFNTINLPFQPSAIFEGENNEICVVANERIYLINFETGSHVLIFKTDVIDVKHRFNDAKVDQKGRLWLGSMNSDLDADSGAIYCLDNKMTLHEKDRAFTVANGLDWSPNQDVFYVVETVKRQIFKYTVDVDTGQLSNKKTLITFDEKDGKPDGLTVDIFGNIWVAMWDGWSIKCLDCNGKLIETISLPVPRPTSVVFAGENLDILIITTASYGLTKEQVDNSPLSGSLLSYSVGGKGSQSHPFKWENRVC